MSNGIASAPSGILISLEKKCSFKKSFVGNGEIRSTEGLIYAAWVNSSVNFFEIFLVKLANIFGED